MIGGSFPFEVPPYNLHLSHHPNEFSKRFSELRVNFPLPVAVWTTNNADQVTAEASPGRWVFFNRVYLPLPLAPGANFYQFFDGEVFEFHALSLIGPILDQITDADAEIVAKRVDSRETHVLNITIVFADTRKRCEGQPCFFGDDTHRNVAALLRGLLAA